MKTAAPLPPDRWRIEIQLHPANIRRRVRYLSLSRGQVRALFTLAGVYALGLLFALAIAPEVIGGLWSIQEYRSLAAERSRQGERLQRLVGQLGELKERAEGLHLRTQKVFSAYGLPPVEPTRRAVAPHREPPAPESIYAAAIDQGNRLRVRITGRLRVLDSYLGQIRDFEAAHPDEVRTTPAACPLRGASFVLTSPFGNRRNPFTKGLSFHAGLDLAAPRGTPIYAPAEGTVIFSGLYPQTRNAAWWRVGNFVLLKNGDRFLTLFGHCDDLLVKAGQAVRLGEPLATVGSSGWSASPFLYYEVRKKGDDGLWRPVDPSVYILDHRWQNEERGQGGEATAFDPLPPDLAAAVSGSPLRGRHRRG